MRYGLLGDRANRTRSTQTLSSPLPSVTVFFDESGNDNPDQPLIVGGVAVDAPHDEVEHQIRSLFERLSAREGLDGWASFEDFKRDGFHACNDPLDVSVPFLDLIGTTLGLRAFLVLTHRKGVADSDDDVIRRLYVALMADIVLSYRRHPKITLLIEHNDKFRDFPEYLRLAVPDRIKQRTPVEAWPELEIGMVAKNEKPVMGVTDYILNAVSRWEAAGRPRDPGKLAYRNFRTIERSISMLHSIEDGLLSTRRVRSS